MTYHKLYENSILLMDGYLIPYTNIKCIYKKETKKNVRYEMEIKKYSGYLLRRADINDGEYLDKI